MRRFALFFATILASAVLAAEPDLSSPKSAAKALWTAVDKADRDAIRGVLYSENDSQKSLVDAFADLLVAGKNLGDASREIFGKSADPIARPMLDLKDFSRLDSADVKESGDSATLTLAGGAKPMTFRKTNGNWKLVVTDFGNASPENLPKQLKLLKTMSTALNDSADQIRDHKFADAAAAESAIQQKLHAVMIDNYRPASRPATAATQAR